MNVSCQKNSEPCRNNEVDVVDPHGLLTAGALERLRGYAQAAMTEMRAKGDVRARLVTDSEMSKAHQKHLGDPSTTDVLTFDLSTGSDLDVDLLLCVDEAARCAKVRGIAIERELLLYLVHGILHCQGHDDKAAEDAASMHDREDAILDAIGVGATYRLSGGFEEAGSA